MAGIPLLMLPEERTRRVMKTIKNDLLDAFKDCARAAGALDAILR